MSTLLFFGDYTKAGAGYAPTSAPTIAVYAVNRTTGVESLVIGSGTCTASGLVGRYFYQLASANLQVFDYHARFHTTDTTADQQDLPALWTRWSEAVTTDTNGDVTINNASVIVGGYAEGQDPGTIAWTYSSRTLTDFEFTVHAEVLSYATGQDPASLLFVNPANKLNVVANGYIQLDMTQSVTIRSQQGNTAPQLGDALQGAWSEAYAAEIENPNSSPPEYIKYQPDGVTAARTFTITTDQNSNPLGRS